MNRQRKLMAVLAVGVALGVAGSALAAGELVWWKFDESSGTTASDSSGNNNAGTLTNMGGTEWTAGKLNNSLNFDGVNDSVIRSALSANITGDCTVSVWMNRSGVPSTNVRLTDLATASGRGMPTRGRFKFRAPKGTAPAISPAISPAVSPATGCAAGPRFGLCP